MQLRIIVPVSIGFVKFPKMVIQTMLDLMIKYIYMYLGVFCPPFVVALDTESGLLDRGVRLPVLLPFMDPTDRAADAAVPAGTQSI